VRAAAYQMTVADCYGTSAVARVRQQVARCESLGVDVLCCPEGTVGGLADYVAPADRLVLPGDADALADALAPIASAAVTTIVGYTERDDAGRLFNAAAVLHRGAVIGRYRKRHPAIRRSVYTPGSEVPVFTVGPLIFGILLCRDSTFPDLARAMAALGAVALFIPTNNGLPPDRAHARVAAAARRTDVALATELGVSVIRADVTGAARGLRSHGSTAIIGPDGRVLAEAWPRESDLIIAEIPTARPPTNASHP